MENIANNKSVTMTVRLNNDISDNFKELAKKEGISQGELIEKLLETYKPEFEITMPLKYKNKFQNELQSIPSKNFKFKGKWIYQIPNIRMMTLFQIKKINEELNINEIEKTFQYNYWFGIAENSDKKMYVISERFWVYNKEQENLINIKRCKLAKNLQEIVGILENYAFELEIEQIENILSEDTTDETELETYLNYDI
ncbi:hypothetical protein HF846_05095 [Clostridium cadaveris]|uniref:ribbon-helix-helix domain-containing protein n=1 Tax=Clostridium cadaveris TaxID=1529 RepID=UPI001459B31D|nr:CopG family transcriptional regulator [Clostridium cadaveris]NME63979.1 hypothetical protein [Clostridium cadaveris]